MTLKRPATELAHVGQASIALDSTVDATEATVFNYPILSGYHKDAACDALGKPTK